MSVATAPGAAAARLDWWPLAVIGSAHLMAVLDTTIMFVALPSIQQGLHMSVASRQWVVTAYTLALAGLLLLGGRLADRFGARRTLIVGVVGFACASAVGGASVDATMLIAARAIQGAFGAVLVSSTKSLLVTVYREDTERTRVLGVFTATLTAGLAVGLVLGGVITSELGWRWCLYLNIIFSVFAVVGAPRVLPQLPRRPEIRIDAASVVFASAGMVGLVYGLGEAASRGWGAGRVVGSLIGAAVLLGCFVARQFGHADRLLPLRVLSDRNRGWGMVALIVNAFSTFGMMLILTYQLQSVIGYSPLETGLALVPFALGAALGSAFVAPRLMRRIPARWLISAAVATEAAGLVPLIWLTAHSGYLPQHHRGHRHGRLPGGSSRHERCRRPSARFQCGHGLGRGRSAGRGDPDRAVREHPAPGGETRMRGAPGAPCPGPPDWLGGPVCHSSPPQPRKEVCMLSLLRGRRSHRDRSPLS
jgi:EmrB/QacA subfamily drug resistance transporter